jgi:hypothetical protein
MVNNQITFFKCWRLTVHVQCSESNLKFLRLVYFPPEMSNSFVRCKVIDVNILKLQQAFRAKLTLINFD